MDFRSKLQDAVTAVKAKFAILKLPKADAIRGMKDTVTGKIAALDLKSKLGVVSERAHAMLDTMYGKLIVTFVVVAVIFAVGSTVVRHFHFSASMSVKEAPAKVEPLIDIKPATEAPSDWRTVATASVEPSPSQDTQTQAAALSAAPSLPPASVEAKAPVAPAVLNADKTRPSATKRSNLTKGKIKKAAAPIKKTSPFLSPEWFSDVFNGVFGSTT